MSEQAVHKLKSALQNFTLNLREENLKFINESELNATLGKILNWLSPENYPTELKTRNILFIVLYTLVVIVSLFGNLFVCYVILKRKRMRTTTNLLMINLTISDLMMTIINIPFSIFRLLVDSWHLGNALCILVPLIQSTSVYVSSLTMTVIAIDRYQAIINPLHKRLSISVPIPAIVAVIWICALIFAFPNYLFFRVVLVGTVPVYRCHDVSPQEGLFSRLHITLYTVATQYVIPLSITAFMYVRISFFIWCRLHDPCITSGIPVTVWMRANNNNNHHHHNNNNNNNNNHTPCDTPSPVGLQTPPPTAAQVPQNLTVQQPVPGSSPQTHPLNEPEYSSGSIAAPVTILHDTTKHSSNYYASIVAIRERSRRKTVKMLGIVVAVFALCWLPLNVYNVIADITQSLTYDINLKLSFHVLAMSSVCYNPFIYFWLNHHYREEMKHLIKYVINCSCLPGRRHYSSTSQDGSISPKSQLQVTKGYTGAVNKVLRCKTPNFDGDHFNYDLTRTGSQKAFRPLQNNHSQQQQHPHCQQSQHLSQTKICVVVQNDRNKSPERSSAQANRTVRHNSSDNRSGDRHSDEAINNTLSVTDNNCHLKKGVCKRNKHHHHHQQKQHSVRNYYQHEGSSSSSTSCPIIGTNAVLNKSPDPSTSSSASASSSSPSQTSSNSNHHHHECQIVFRAVSSYSDKNSLSTNNTNNNNNNIANPSLLATLQSGDCL